MARKNNYYNYELPITENYPNMNAGIYELENPNVLWLFPFKTYGSPAKIAEFFGGNENYYRAIEELKTQIYSVA